MSAVEAQRFSALARANEVRKSKADLKARLKLGELSLLDALKDPCTQSAKIEAILRCLPSIGPNRTRTILKRVCIGHYRRVESLTDAEVSRLLGELA